jgi:transitional endoplasmic reticulum ATPase
MELKETLNDRFQRLVAEQVERKGMTKNKRLKVTQETGCITVPTTSIKEAIETLQYELAYQEEPVNIRETIVGCFWDGAHAFGRAMEKQFGWVHGVSDWGNPPQEKSIATGVGTTTLVPWGKFKVPGIEGGVISTAFERDAQGRFLFCIAATVKRKDEEKIRNLAIATREYLKTGSLYKGKAIKIKFRDSDGEYLPMPEPVFLDVSSANIEGLIFSDEVWSAIETSIFTPIRYTEACRQNNVPLKRGVLLEGVYGTGKTLALFAAAKVAQDNGWTSVYCEDITELEDCIRFGMTYGPSVVQCEDIDRVMSGNRNMGMDDILNIVDGVESKNNDLMVLLTTNNVGAINKAMVRPGRLDDVIEVKPPDASAVERLIRYYAGPALDAETSLVEIGNVLNGRIPAVIRECVERAKLSQIKLSKGEVQEGGLKITVEALLDAANTMGHQLALLDATKEEIGVYEGLGRLIGALTGGPRYDTTVSKLLQIEKSA